MTRFYFLKNSPEQDNSSRLRQREILSYPKSVIIKFSFSLFFFTVRGYRQRNIILHSVENFRSFRSNTDKRENFKWNIVPKSIKFSLPLDVCALQCVLSKHYPWEQKLMEGSESVESKIFILSKSPGELCIYRSAYVCIYHILSHVCASILNASCDPFSVHGRVQLRAACAMNARVPVGIFIYLKEKHLALIGKYKKGIKLKVNFLKPL